MNKVLWLLQVLLALAFLAHGILLLFPPADMVAQMNESMSTSFRMFLGVAEVVAAIGLTLPGMTRIQPWWTQWAAAGIMIVMISATYRPHSARGKQLGDHHRRPAGHGDLCRVHALEGQADRVATSPAVAEQQNSTKCSDERSAQSRGRVRRY